MAALAGRGLSRQAEPVRNRGFSGPPGGVHTHTEPQKHGRGPIRFQSITQTSSVKLESLKINTLHGQKYRDQQGL